MSSRTCFLVYDYASFPQKADAPEDEAALLEVLSGMNLLISNVLVLAAPDYLERGWCIYEYTVASMRASIICDEMNHQPFVLPRNLAATRPPVSARFLGSSVESEIQNAKNQQTLETINTILPLFDRSKFTVERDRETVRDLLVSELLRTLPNKQEYLPYLGEWRVTPWTEEELREAFTSDLKWEPLQYARTFKPFEPNVPTTLAEAVACGYRLDRMPPQNDWTWTTLHDWKPLQQSAGELAKIVPGPRTDRGGCRGRARPWAAVPAGAMDPLTSLDRRRRARGRGPGAVRLFVSRQPFEGNDRVGHAMQSGGAA